MVILVGKKYIRGERVRQEVRRRIEVKGNIVDGNI